MPREKSQEGPQSHVKYPLENTETILNLFEETWNSNRWLGAEQEKGRFVTDILVLIFILVLGVCGLRKSMDPLKQYRSDIVRVGIMKKMWER
jgi:hypothetical protein